MSDVAGWRKTAITDTEPRRIKLRGHPSQTLIGHLGFPEMIWLMVRDGRPTPAKVRLFKAAVISAVDHGPQAYQSRRRAWL
ncbi:citrate synthase [Rhodobacteraceae bacterium KLH11]|nr:citrate synthase [Rhodobacteraceae bacterium KLH11]